MICPMLLFNIKKHMKEDLITFKDLSSVAETKLKYHGGSDADSRPRTAALRWETCCDRGETEKLRCRTSQLSWRTVLWEISSEFMKKGRSVTEFISELLKNPLTLPDGVDLKKAWQRRIELNGKQLNFWKWLCKQDDEETRGIQANNSTSEGEHRRVDEAGGDMNKCEIKMTVTTKASAVTAV